MRLDFLIVIHGSVVLERSVGHAPPAVLVAGGGAVSAEASHGVPHRGFGGGRRVSDPVPVHRRAGVAAVVEGFLVDGHEEAVPGEEAGEVVDYGEEFCVHDGEVVVQGGISVVVEAGGFLGHADGGVEVGGLFSGGGFGPGLAELGGGAGCFYAEWGWALGEGESGAG